MAALGCLVAEFGAELNIELEGTLQARLESSEIHLRGIIVTGETEEEKQVLANIWCQGGRPAAFERTTGSVALTVAPTPEQDKEG